MGDLGRQSPMAKLWSPVSQPSGEPIGRLLLHASVKAVADAVINAQAQPVWVPGVQRQQLAVGPYRVALWLRQVFVTAKHEERLRREAPEAR